MLNLLNTLETVFQKYIPWHSEQEVKAALSAVAELKKELQGDAPAAEQVVETAEKVVEPDPTPAPATATETAAPNADVATEMMSVTPVVTADPVHIPEPEIQPFPGSYTPPPAA